MAVQTGQSGASCTRPPLLHHQDADRRTITTADTLPNDLRYSLNCFPNEGAH